MRATRFSCLLLCLLLPGAGSLAQYLLVTDTVHITVPSTLDSVRVTSSGVLIADDSIAVLGNMAIDSGGVVTHSQRLPAGLRLKVSGTLAIASGGAMDVSGKGLLGGYQAGNAFGGSGETFNSTGDTIKAGSAGGHCGAGGSYGGQGASSSPALSGAPYGLLEVPAQVGSGGGGNHWNGPGGNGGGRIRVIAGELIVNGAIRANGIDGTNSGGFYGGGGSGGGIWLTTGNLSGTGPIEANGGASAKYNCVGASGGGGRVAIFFDNMSLPMENIAASAGAGDCSHGSAGTIYLKDNARSTGSLTVDNAGIASDVYTPWKSGLTSFFGFQILRSAKLEVGQEINIEGPLLMSGGAKISRP